MNDPRPTVKERFDAMMKLAEFRMEVRKERRHHGWRVSLGLWVGMAAGMVAFKGQSIPTRWLEIALSIVVLGHMLIWVRGNFVRNERDAKKAYDLLSKAEALMNISLPDQEWTIFRKKPPWWLRWLGPAKGAKSYRWFGFVFDPPPLAEVLTTALLAAAWIFVNYQFGAQPREWSE